MRLSCHTQGAAMMIIGFVCFLAVVVACALAPTPTKNIETPAAPTLVGDAARVSP